MKPEKPKKLTRPASSPGASKRPVARKKSTVKPVAGRAKGAPEEEVEADIPSILLEGDAPAPIGRSGPGERYSLGPTPVGAPPESLSDALPEAYGTKRLLLVARDPAWLYAHWDLTAEQLRHYNSLSADKHLVLRVHREAIEEQPFAEVHVHPESRHWFVHVARGGTRFLAELGYYNRQRRWTRISASDTTLTPPDSLSDDLSVRFETLPVEVSMRQLVSMVKSLASENESLLDALGEMRESGHPQLPAHGEVARAQWTPAQDAALAEALSIDDVRRVWIGSLEITELVRRQLLKELSSAVAAQFSLPSSLTVSSLSSPFGGLAGRGKGFWFNVNAELIIYGATEPDAQVTIGDRVIKLRPDGTFSYRFALPDGQYELPAVAISNDRTDSRSASLKFSRKTTYGGEVGTHPQDPALKPPRVEHVR
jgi:hypothetical protein